LGIEGVGSLKIHPGVRNLVLLALLTASAVLVHGYHPGAEDDCVYLSAVKLDLHPGLYPHRSAFFKLQLQATAFDRLIAASIFLTRLPVAWAALLWHFASIFLVLWGCWRIGRRCFAEPHAQWAGVALVAALLTLPVAGTALYFVDQYLHPRALATAAILAAVVAVLDRRRILATVLLAVALTIHPIMAALGMSFCFFLDFALARQERMDRRSGPLQAPTPLGLAALAPMGWIFEPVSDAWRKAANGSNCYFLSRWEWYEWLGVFAPLLLLWWIRHLSLRNGSATAARIASSLVWYGSFQFLIAVAILGPHSLERLRPFQPMRYLHLLYLLLALLGGGMIGQKILRRHAWRWILLFLPLTAGMFYAQRQVFSGTEHLELPGGATRNPWVAAFQWASRNTPTNALFALDPQYVRAPGEDYHSFRAIAERDMLADAVKDAPVVTQVPRLAPEWQEETEARAGWSRFQKPDFERLRARYGVTWIVLERPGVAGLNCPFQNDRLLVCRLD
jgi:hypothetical protein